MTIKVYYSEISAHKEVKKRQQKVMMILDSKSIPYDAVDITEAGKESDKEFMLTNAKPRGETKNCLSPQIFNGETYCGDFDDFELANEIDELEKFLNIERVERKTSLMQNGAMNGTSREGSAEKQETKVVEEEQPPPPAEPAETVPQEEETHPTFNEEEQMSTSEPAQEPPIVEEGLDNVEPDPEIEEEEEEE